ncbi:MAG: hypothetical protein IMW89_01520 [Ktedonobacteraceae bacterium]|nr:hypothetical protein [Ktedonobacteraceae bacterium]
MPAFTLPPVAQRIFAQPAHRLIPLLAGSLMLAASILPWINDPLGTGITAWHLPLAPVWQFHSELLNYGQICLACALFSFSLALLSYRREESTAPDIAGFLLAAGLLSLLPCLLFFVQYLCVDMGDTGMLTQHTIQSLLIQQRFGYKMPGALVQIQPFEISDSTLSGRLQVLANLVNTGVFLPLISAGLLCGAAVASAGAGNGRPLHLSFPHRKTLFWCAPAFIAVLLLSGHGPAALICNAEAKEQLARGDYTAALHWLDAARALNPALDQAAFYHIQRGQVWYFLHPGQQSTESHAYLAFVYRQQGNNVGAYQELLAAQQVQQTPAPWLLSEINLTLIDLAETIQRQNGPLIQRIDFDATALPWLQKLLAADTTNIYGHYALGRIQYNLHNYDSCIAEMSRVLQLSQNDDIRSSAYTYIALSMGEKGDIAAERRFLLQAIAADPGYHNNTAREELSGLH